MGKSEARDALVQGARETLRPIVRRLLASGIPFGELEAELRALFVDVAHADFVLPGRAQTDSRIALLTGINRKEVRRLRARRDVRLRPSSFARNQAASLASRWLAEPRATDRTGRPKPLPYQAARGPSFVKLARQVTVDLPPRAILDELIRRGAAEMLEGNRVALKSDAYVPKLGRAEKLAMLAEDPPELVETMLANVLDDALEPLLQRKVYYDNLGAAALPRLRRELRREGERFLRAIDRRLAAYDRDRNPQAPGGPRHTAGLGVYYFEYPGTRPARGRRPKE